MRAWLLPLIGSAFLYITDITPAAAQGPRPAVAPDMVAAVRLHALLAQASRSTVVSAPRFALPFRAPSRPIWQPIHADLWPWLEFRGTSWWRPTGLSTWVGLGVRF
jgi:hypothetical protein